MIANVNAHTSIIAGSLSIGFALSGFAKYVAIPETIKNRIKRMRRTIAPSAATVHPSLNDSIIASAATTAIAAQTILVWGNIVLALRRIASSSGIIEVYFSN